MRMAIIDHTESYRRFRDQAKQAGFAKNPPEDIELVSKVTVTVASDAGKVKTFFDSTPTILTDGTLDPLVKNQQALPSDLALCIHSAGLEVEHENYAGTLTELRDALSTLGDSVLTIFGNSDRILQWRGSKCLYGRPGSSNYTDTATATATVRGPIERPTGLIPLAVPKVIPAQGQIKAELQLPAAFTTNDNLSVALVLGVWLARRGAPAPDALTRASFAL